MLLNWLKERNLKLKIDRKLNDQEVKMTSGNSQNLIKSVLFLSDESCELDLVRILKDNLGINVIDKNIYVNKLNKKDINENQFSKRDISFFGKFKTESLQKSVNFEYDLLINYSIDNLYLKYLTVNSNSKFKVGFSACDERLYDLMIQVKIEDNQVFVNELKKYLKIFKKI